MENKRNCCYGYDFLKNIDIPIRIYFAHSGVKYKTYDECGYYIFYI